MISAIRMIALTVVAVLALANCQSVPQDEKANLNKHCAEWRTEKFCFEIPKEWVGKCGESGTCIFGHSVYVPPGSENSNLSLIIINRGSLTLEDKFARYEEQIFNAKLKFLAEKGTVGGPCLAASGKRGPPTATRAISSGDFALKYKEIGPWLNWKNIQRVDEFTCRGKPFGKLTFDVFQPVLEGNRWLFVLQAWLWVTEPNPGVFGTQLGNKVYRNTIAHIGE